MIICTRVARNGLSYSGSTERASRCVQTFLMATRNRAPAFSLFLSYFFFSFYLSRYDRLVTTLLNERSLDTFFFSIDQNWRKCARARVRSKKGCLISFRFRRIHATNVQFLDWIENVINEWGRNESIVRFLPIFRASSSQKILQRILIKSVSTKNKTKRLVDAQRRSMARKITFRRDFQRGSVSSPETDLWILSFPLFSGYSDITFRESSRFTRELNAEESNPFH